MFASATRRGLFLESGSSGFQIVPNIRWWAVALRGLLSIGFGIMVLFLPLETMLSLVMLFAIYLLIDGGFALAAAIGLAGPSSTRKWLIFEGAMDILIGFLMLFLPSLSLLALVFLTAFWSVTTGVFIMIAVALAPRRLWADVLFLFAGFISVFYGTVLLCDCFWLHPLWRRRKHQGSSEGGIGPLMHKPGRLR